MMFCSDRHNSIEVDIRDPCSLLFAPCGRENDDVGHILKHRSTALESFGKTDSEFAREKRGVCE